MNVIYVDELFFLNALTDYLLLLSCARLRGRALREYTQKEVADRMGISQSYISRLEKRILLRLRREMQKIMA